MGPWHVQPSVASTKIRLKNGAEAKSWPDPSEQLAEAAVCSSGGLFRAEGAPWGGCSKAFPSLPLLSGVALVSQLRKGFWHLLELVFLAANGALNTHLGLQASQPTVASGGIFLQ